MTKCLKWFFRVLVFIFFEDNLFELRLILDFLFHSFFWYINKTRQKQFHLWFKRNSQEINRLCLREHKKPYVTVIFIEEDTYSEILLEKKKGRGEGGKTF